MKFDWSDLHDKTVKIYVGQDEECGVKTTVVLGIDTETNDSYVLHTKTEYTSTFDIEDYKKVCREQTEAFTKFISENGKEFAARQIEYRGDK